MNNTSFPIFTMHPSLLLMIVLWRLYYWNLRTSTLFLLITIAQDLQNRKFFCSRSSDLHPLLLLMVILWYTYRSRSSDLHSFLLLVTTL